MSSKGNPLLRIRLPKDHWVWQIKKTEERADKVKSALSFYHEFAEKIYRIDKAIPEIQKALVQIREQGMMLRQETNVGDSRDKYTDEVKAKEEALFNAIDNFIEL